MSSYLDYFCKNNAKTDEKITDCEIIRGTCFSMCPPDEVKLRESAHMIHILEVVGDARKPVKSYSRSAADSCMAVPQLLRPYSVLTQTVQYLLFDVTKRRDVPSSVVYDFVNDRLRAVRQDMTIQRLTPDECVRLLEPMVRFYVYYGFMLSELPLNQFDPVLNKKYLLECTKWCLNSFDKTEQANRDVIDRLRGFLNRLDVNTETDKQLSCDRVLVECLYILCNLDSIHSMYRYAKLPEDLVRDPKLRLAYDIALANYNGNYVKVCKLMDKLCPLTYCAVFCYLPTLQRRSFQVLSHAYHNKRLSIPSDVIARWLQFSDPAEAAGACAHYGLHVEGAAIRFDKTEFKLDASLHTLKRLDLNKKYKLGNLQDIYTYV